VDSNQIKQIKRLVELFEERDRLYQQSTEKILEAVGPTALEALFTLFDVRYESVTWLEAQLVDNIMLIVASIAYEDDSKVPDIIRALSPVPEEGRPTIRLFRVGLPIELIFKTKEEIVEYLTQAAEPAAKRSRQRKEAAQAEDESVPVNVVTPQPEFDTSGLTHEQIQQLLIFGSETKGIKH
jgi:hypothetical protein